MAAVQDRAVAGNGLTGDPRRGSVFRPEAPARSPLTRRRDGGNTRETEEMSLRATTVYRREDGAWKVIHRHGDSLMTVEIDPEGRR